MEIDAFIRALPKAELHLHLEGTVPLALTREYAARDANAEPPPAPSAWWEPSFRFADFNDFQDAMRSMFRPVLQTVEGYHRVTQVALRDLAAVNVRYAEISIGVGLALRAAPLDEVLAAMQSAVPPGMVVRLIVAFNRRVPLAEQQDHVAAVMQSARVDGIDLHGDERLSHAAPFAGLFTAARERGLLLRAHAGELRGAESVRETLDALHVKRIEHGTTAAQDETLVQRLLDEGVTLDLCPTSNVKLRVVNSIAAHPIGTLLRRGVSVTCSTDDPTVFGCTLESELQALVEQQGFTRRELAQLQINAFQAARLPDNERAALLAEIETLLTQV